MYNIYYTFNFIYLYMERERESDILPPLGVFFWPRPINLCPKSIFYVELNHVVSLPWEEGVPSCCCSEFFHMNKTQPSPGQTHS